MRTKSIIITTTVIVITTIIGMLGAYAESNKSIKNEVLIGLEKEKENLQQNHKQIPESLLNKIEFEKENTNKFDEEYERLEKEQEELNDKFAKAPKDEKGNAIINKTLSNDMEDVLIKKQYLIKTTATPDFKELPHLYPNYNLTSQVFVDNMIIFSGYSKEDDTIGFIAYICKEDNNSTIIKDFIYEGKGKIEFQEILENEDSIKFTYVDNKIGYFDIISKKAIFN